MLQKQHVFKTTTKRELKLMTNLEEMDFEHYTQSIFYDLEFTTKYIKRMGYNYCSELNMGVGPEELLALDIIYLNPGICQRDLAKKLLKDRAGTGRVLLQLEAKGFVERFVDTKGNRLVRKMKLTESGENMLGLATEKIKPYVKKLKEAFSEEDKNQLKNLLDKFRRILAGNVTTQI